MREKMRESHKGKSPVILSFLGFRIFQYQVHAPSFIQNQTIAFYQYGYPEFFA
jgi:hypothetical protein